MKVAFQKIESKSKKTKCSCCGAFIFTGEKYWQVINAANGRNVADGRYCQHCENELWECWENDLDLSCVDDDDNEEGLRRREEFGAYQASGAGTQAFFDDLNSGYIR